VADGWVGRLLAHLVSALPPPPARALRPPREGVEVSSGETQEGGARGRKDTHRMNSQPRVKAVGSSVDSTSGSTASDLLSRSSEVRSCELS
jgi:hypothetical protein